MFYWLHFKLFYLRKWKQYCISVIQIAIFSNNRRYYQVISVSRCIDVIPEHFFQGMNIDLFWYLVILYINLVDLWFRKETGINSDFTRPSKLVTLKKNKVILKTQTHYNNLFRSLVFSCKSSGRALCRKVSNSKLTRIEAPEYR